jgi:hypothetical protein
MFSKSILSRQQQQNGGGGGGKNWSPRQYVKNWLIGSRGLSSLVSECNSIQQQQQQIYSLNPMSSSTASIKSGIALVSADADKVTSIVNRYRKLLVHSSSWELLSPQQILTCLGASSIPMYSESDKNLIMLQHQEEKSETNNNKQKQNSATASSANEQIESAQNEIPIFERNINRVVEAEFAENVWSAALPSLNSFSVTMTSFEAAAVVRSAHRLSCAVPPSLLQLCASRFTSEYIPDVSQRDAQIFEIFVPQQQQQQKEIEEEDETILVKNAIVLMVRTAHSFSSQASLLSQQQSRHEKLSQSKSMLKMIQDMIANREEQQKGKVSKNPHCGSNYSISSPQGRKDCNQKSSEFPTFLYTPEIIQSCSKSCAEATISLLETATGFFVVEDDGDSSSDEERKALLERQRELLSLFSWSSLSVSIEALSLIKNYYYDRPKQDNVSSVLVVSTCRIAQLSNILTRELIRRVESSSNATTTARFSSSSSQQQQQNNNHNHLFSLSMIRQTYPLVKNICQNCLVSSTNRKNDDNTNRSEKLCTNVLLLDEQSYSCVFLANDLYVTLTHRLGSYVRKLAFAQGPEDFEEFVNCAIEMEKAAHVIQECYTMMEIDKKRRTMISSETITDSNTAESSMMLNRMFSQSNGKGDGPSSSKLHLLKSQQHQNSSSSVMNTSFDDIFKGERHSLDGPLVVESVANYFDHVVELMKKKSSSSSFSLASYYLTSTLSLTKSSSSSSSDNLKSSSSSSYYYNSNKKFGEINKLSAGGNQRFNKFYQQQFLKTFKDIDRYSLQTSVAPLCIGSLVVWCEIEEIRTPAIQILSKSLRNLSSTHLVRVCQLVPKLRSNGFIGGRESSSNINKLDLDDDYSVETKNEVDPSVTTGMSESEYAHFIDELLAAIYVSYKDLSTIGCCVCLRALAELSVVEKELLRKTSSSTLDRENNDDSEEQQDKFTPHVLPIGALSLCVQSLTARVAELLENEATMITESKTNNSVLKENSPFALSSDQRVNDANAVLITKGYSTKLILEHIGTSLSMLGMLPGGAGISSPPKTPSSSSTTSSRASPEDDRKSSSTTNDKDAKEGKLRRKRGEEGCSTQEELLFSVHRSNNNIRSRSTFKDTMKMMEM